MPIISLDEIIVVLVHVLMLSSSSRHHQPGTAERVLSEGDKEGRVLIRKLGNFEI